jgi:hypothetical protein
VVNPFAASKILVDEKGVFADHATLVRGSFLYRVIDFELPFRGRFVYNGWWFRQLVQIDDYRTWMKISWLQIHRRIEFVLPAEIDPQCRKCLIEIHFGTGLRIRRFQVTVGGIVVYDEIS